MRAGYRGLLFSGISSIIAGLRGGGRSEDENGRRNTASTGSRALSVAAGGLAIALSIMIMVSPMFGIALAGIIVGVAPLLVYGIRLVVTGISGGKGEQAVKLHYLNEILNSSRTIIWE